MNGWAVVSLLVSLIGTPAVLSQEASSADRTVRQTIRARLGEILARPALATAKVGLYVTRIDDGQRLFAHNQDTLLIPASNVKIVTTAAALHGLSPDFRFRTEIFGLLDEQGFVDGDLYVKGHGDPSLLPERVWYLANRLYFQGVREIRGGIVVDDSYFDGPRLAAGWEQDLSSYAYMAPIGALSVGFNAVLVHVLPGASVGQAARVFLDPVSDYPVVQTDIKTTSHGRTVIDVSVTPHKDRSIVRVTGRISKKDGGRGFWRRIDNPPIFAGEVLKAALTQVGVKVQGGVSQGHAPAEPTPLLAIQSPRLAELVDRVNKNSNNFMAEQIALTLGAERYGPPGTWEKAHKAMRSFLEEEVGFEPGTYVLGNASGLHDVNRFTPRQLVRLLAFMYNQRKIRTEYVASMAVAGSAGTLSSRMRNTEAEYMIRAKTGTLTGASALSGYATARSGEVLAFSILVNDYQAPAAEVLAAQDEIGSLLASMSFAPTSTAALPASSSNDQTPSVAGVEVP